MSQEPTWIVLDVYPEEEELVERLREASSDTKELTRSRLGGAEAVMQVAVPATIALLELIVTVVLHFKRAGGRRIRIGRRVVNAEDLTEDELWDMLEAATSKKDDELGSRTSN